MTLPTHQPPKGDTASVAIADAADAAAPTRRGHKSGNKKPTIIAIFVLILIASVTWVALTSVAHHSLHFGLLTQVLYKRGSSGSSKGTGHSTDLHDGGDTEFLESVQHRQGSHGVELEPVATVKPHWQDLQHSIKRKEELSDLKKKTTDHHVAEKKGSGKGKKGGKGRGKGGKGRGAGKKHGKDHDKHEEEASTFAPPVVLDSSSNNNVDTNAKPLAIPAAELTTQNALAYLIILSNEDFVDGALVLGASLRHHSPLLQSGKADMVTITTEGRLSRDSHRRMLSVGFTHVAEVKSLAKRAPKAFWKDTFDKVYMFNMTQYKKIVFMDADMVCVKSMDGLFEKDYGDHTFVGAIGNHGGSNQGGRDSYFQTGMMVIQPSSEMFGKIMAEFESGIPPKGNKYNHGMNGRDGVLLRNVFLDNFHEIDNKYSRNLNPRYRIPQNVAALHLRGKHKPWFDRIKPNKDPELGKKEFGFPYVTWWSIYDEIHRNSAEYKLANKLHNGGSERKLSSDEMQSLKDYGGAFAADNVNPLTHVWMMRHSASEYVQLTTEEDKRQRDKTIDGLEYLVATKPGMSCKDVCESASKECKPEAFNFTKMQDCEFLKEKFDHQCDTCEVYVYWKQHPGNDFPGLDFTPVEKAKLKNNKKKGGAGDVKPICKYNLMYDHRSQATCLGSNETTTRLCPCA